MRPSLEDAPGSSAAAGPGELRRRTAVDLFSGTGGATAAFVDRGWRVVTVDCLVDAGRRPAVQADARALPFPDVGRPFVDFLWASPPCTEFSQANARVNRVELRPSLELVFAALAAVRSLRPKFWVIENVRGALPFLGIPAQKIGPWCLWGYFPQITPPLSMQVHEKGGGRTALERAHVPYDLSDAIAQAVELALDAGLTSLLDLRPFRRHRHRASPGRRPPPAPELAL